jgi:hypothetical protein
MMKAPLFFTYPLLKKTKTPASDFPVEASIKIESHTNRNADVRDGISHIPPLDNIDHNAPDTEEIEVLTSNTQPT